MLLESGAVYGCGSNASGQLGFGDSKVQLQDCLNFKPVSALSDVRDIACGWEHSLVCTASGALYSFGHPQYGQLGHGLDSGHLDTGNKIRYSCVHYPRQVNRFVRKDSHGKVTSEFTSSAIRIRAVAAGKNHSVCVEDWEEQTAEGAGVHHNRVFSWGFGGYGRLGHGGAEDEGIPREVMTLSAPQMATAVHKQKMIREVHCGSTFTLAVAVTQALYFFGKMSNSPRGEAVMYPRVQDELYDYPVRAAAAGSNCVFVASGTECIAWGMPVAGRFGFEGDAKQATSPKLVSRLSGLTVSDISCGYGHVCVVVDSASTSAERLNAFLEEMPKLIVQQSQSQSRAVVKSNSKKHQADDHDDDDDRDKIAKKKKTKKT